MLGIHDLKQERMQLVARFKVFKAQLISSKARLFGGRMKLFVHGEKQEINVILDGAWGHTQCPGHGFTTHTQTHQNVLY